MRRTTDLLCAMLFFLLTALPGAQMIFGFSKVEVLHGVEEDSGAELPRLRSSDFFSEHFQHSLEKWWDENIGFRGQLVRSDNQLNFGLFREISASYASPLIVGKRNSLFEKLYVEHQNGLGYVPEKRLQNLARRLMRTQELLKKRGIDFALLISPSKASIYEEDIPERYLDPKRTALQSNYKRLVPLLEAMQVNFVDGRALLEQWKTESQEPMFPKGGTHWTQLTACRVSAALIEKLQTVSRTTLRVPPCTPTEEKAVPEPFDRDLADLANVWHPTPFYEKLRYPVLPEPRLSPDETQPRMLFVGGSFLWSLFVYLDAYRVYSARDMFYYYNRRFEYPSERVSPIDRHRIDWEADIFKNRFIVIEVNEITIHSLGSGFLEDALEILKGGSGEALLEEPRDPTEFPTPPDQEPPPSQP